MKIVAFLQNQWARDPVAMKRIYDRYATDLNKRADLNARFLFYQSLTGRRLKMAFGEKCDEIIWEEATTEITAVSSAAPRPNPAHIKRVLEYHSPHAVMIFGAGHRQAVLKAIEESERVIDVMIFAHPAARTITSEDLIEWKKLLTTYLAQAN